MKKNMVHVVLSLFMPMVLTTAVHGQWVKTNWSADANYFRLYADQNRIFARTWDTLSGGRMFLTADNGANWTRISSADSSIGILSVVMLDTVLLAGTWDGFYRSTSGGTSWDAVTATGIPADIPVWSIAMINATLFTGTKGSIYKSSDSGATWTEIKSGIPANARILTIAGIGNAIFAGSDTSGIYITTNGGTTWTAANSGLTDKHIIQLAVMGSKIFAVTLEGVFISDNNGTSWTANSSILKSINCLIVAGDQLFAGTDTNGVYLSADSGATWSAYNSGIPAGTRVWSMALGTDNIFAGTSSGVWRTPVSINTVLKSNPSLKGSRLHFRRQNGSQVTIVFRLAGPETADLELYDLCGNRIVSLVHKRFGAGVQSVSFNTGSIAPGSYIVRLIAGTAVYQQATLIQRY